jgi:hypothetical protein
LPVVLHGFDPLQLRTQACECRLGVGKFFFLLVDDFLRSARDKVFIAEFATEARRFLLELLDIFLQACLFRRLVDQSGEWD